MTLHRFFVPEETLVGDTVALPADSAHQIAQVLRLRPGERIILLGGGGLEHEAQLEAVARAAVIARIVATRPAVGEPALRLTLCPALLKADKFEGVIQKCTELGVAAFQPVISARCVSEAASAQKLARWRHIAQEAAEQSGRGCVPPVEPPRPLPDALKQAGGLMLMAHEVERVTSLHAALAGQSLAEGVCLFIGPEGGFDEREVALAREAGALPVSLGLRILRAETASVAAVAAIMHERGEMG
ncbi:MAG: 16S rRNA (uracil(1498)-N(3))-methyltransferase [Chloroflexi bacterium]|nr:16S rRNA (uracil(1498)-N(3))-methyltransferase [Chloroflexota bacterium]